MTFLLLQAPGKCCCSIHWRCCCCSAPPPPPPPPPPRGVGGTTPTGGGGCSCCTCRCTGGETSGSMGVPNDEKSAMCDIQCPLHCEEKWGYNVSTKKGGRYIHRAIFFGLGTSTPTRQQKAPFLNAAALKSPHNPELVSATFQYKKGLS